MTTGPNVRPGEKPPRLGAIGNERTVRGATVAGAYYFRALDWTIATNDDWLIARIALPSCDACRRVHEGLAALRARNETEMGGRIHIVAAVVDRVSYKIKYDYAVRVTYNEDAVRLRLADRSIHEAQPKVRGQTDIVFLQWKSGVWRVVEVTES